jgi:dTDP-glucose 4,6-dehydratase
MARSYYRTYGLDVRITRSSNNYGPRQYPEKIIPLFISNLFDGQEIPIYGNGLNVRDWLHVDDHCRGIYTVLMSGSAGEIYNIGGGCELSNIEISKKILSLMGKDQTKIKYVSDRLGHDFRYSVDCRKIKRLLGFKPLIDLKIGLAETISWYQENESWWRPLKS